MVSNGCTVLSQAPQRLNSRMEDSVVVHETLMTNSLTRQQDFKISYKHVTVHNVDVFSQLTYHLGLVRERAHDVFRPSRILAGVQYPVAKQMPNLCFIQQETYQIEQYV